MSQELSPEEIEAIAACGTSKTYPKHTILISEGDRSDFLYVIIQGRVKIFVGDEKGREVILNIQGPGEYFGEIALIDESPRSASVMTLEPSRLAFVSRDDFTRYLGAHPDTALKLLRAFAHRIRELTELAKNLALSDVYGRVARTLLKMARERDDGQWVIEQRLTHQDIADMVGASREMVSRIMKDLAKGGYIQTQKKIITICHRLPPGW